MKKKMARLARRAGLIAAGVLILGLALDYGLVMATKRVAEQVTISKMEFVKEDTGRYMIWTKDADGITKIYQHKRCLIVGNFDPKAVYGELEIGRTYDFAVYGFRNEMMQKYQNILWIEKEYD